jgi:hypothetical protein
MFWTVLTIVIVTFVPQHASNAVGGSKFHADPHWTVLFAAQVNVGGVVSVIRTISVQVAVFVQQSWACHVMVSIKLHGAALLVTTFSIVTSGFGQQLSVAGGGRIGEPH